MRRYMRLKKHLTSFQIIIMGFAGVILAGAFLLMLPFSSTSGKITPFFDALFTSTSAVCVTGLVVVDSGSYWTMFGQAVILLLIQIGGLGVITIAVAFAMLSGKKISLMQRSVMQSAISAPQVGGIVRLTRFILGGTFLIEITGAVAMMPSFCNRYGMRGIWMAVFHSISAFCNAGFDILGTKTHQFASLTGYSRNGVINITIMLLIIIGGIGFLTWEDIYLNRFQWKRYRVWNALFQSVTTRTAGYNTADLTAMSGASQALMIILMLIGGAPGSTAGGMKTTTFAVMIANAAATFRRRDQIQVFHRRLNDEVVRNAATIAGMYMALFFCGAFAISVIEHLPLSACLFETASAVGTVGLTLGVTPGLGVVSKGILIMLMYFGRVGGLTLIYAAVPEKSRYIARYPEEKINVG